MDERGCWGKAELQVDRQDPLRLQAALELYWNTLDHCSFRDAAAAMFPKHAEVQQDVAIYLHR